ncbi:aldose epimerase family protein [Bacillota bacterium Meth-B3]
MGIAKTSFGRLPDGREATLYTLKNTSGAWVSITDFGGTLVSLGVPDREGTLGDVLLGYPTVAGYTPNMGYLGALIGRVGNRIAHGRCLLNGEPLKLATRSNGHHLHGGGEGFDRKLWTASPDEAAGTLTLAYVSPDGEEHYPGTLSVTVVYGWSEDNALSIRYTADCDRDTLCNLTNHAYFNLEGEGSGTIEAHTLRLDADFFTVTDRDLIPTGELRAVDGTPFDLRQPKLLSEGLGLTKSDEQLGYGGGYDHNFCLNGEGFREAGLLYAPASGRAMVLETDQPGVQFYAGNTLSGVNGAKCGRVYGMREGLCLETQAYPDAPNHAHFPSIVLRAGARYDTRTTYQFFVQ